MAKNNINLLNDFINCNKQFMEQPIIKSFLSHENNYRSFQKAVFSPTKENKENLDILFKNFYREARTIKYISMLIHYSAIDFDKKFSLQQKRYPLTLDQPINHETCITTLLDTLTGTDQDVLEEVYNKNFNRFVLTDYFENKKLAAAIEKLKPKQRLILKYKYVDNLRNKEIAEIFNDTPQNISKTNKKILQKLKMYMEGEHLIR